MVHFDKTNSDLLCRFSMVVRYSSVVNGIGLMAMSFATLTFPAEMEALLNAVLEPLPLEPFPADVSSPWVRFFSVGHAGLFGCCS
jgi:hypothetical protein